MRGAPEWTKTKGQKKKDRTRQTQEKEQDIPLQRLKEPEFGPPSYTSSNANITLEGDNQHEPQAPPLEEKARYQPTTEPSSVYNRPSVYPELLNQEMDYSDANTLRARKLSSGDDRES